MPKKFNFDLIFKKKKISNLLLKKNFFLNNLKNKNYTKNISIELIGGYTSSDLSEWIKIFCGNNDITCNLIDSKWGGGFSSIKTIKNNQKNIDFVVLINSWRDLFPYNNFNNLIYSIDGIVKIFEKFFKQNKSKTIVTTFDYPNFDIDINHTSLKKIISFLNNEIYRIFSNNINYNIIDEQYNITSKNIEWQSTRDWHAFGKIFTNECSIVLAHKIADKIKYSYLSTKKMLILDLDNTIWGGIIGDDGLDNIKLGDDSAEGRIFNELQSYFKMIKNRGVLLSIVSKNEKNIALEGLKYNKSILKISDFVTTRINWKDKSENILSIAKELNLNTSSFVFVDDNPFERDLVKKKLPDVSVPDIGNYPENYIDIINDYNYFNIDGKITKEDLHRTNLYKTEKLRNKSKKNISNKNFLKSLKIEIEFDNDNKNNLERIHQLTNKTNQFNLTTERIQINQIKKFIENPKKKIIVVNAKDKYGDYGIISILYATIKKNNLEINNWVMSCRVFNKTIEHAIIFSIMKKMKKKQLRTLSLTFILSKKNQLMIDLLKNLGFVINKKLSTIKSKWILKNNNINHECKIKNEI